MNVTANKNIIEPIKFWNTDVSRIAHVIIDVQKRFASATQGHGTPETDQIAKDIKNICPEFSELGVKNIIVYSDAVGAQEQGIEKAAGGLLYLTPSDSSIPPISKLHNSALYPGSELSIALLEHQITHVLVSGFNAESCVLETVQGGLQWKQEDYEQVLADLKAEGDGIEDPKVEIAVLSDLIGTATTKTNPKIIQNSLGAMSKAGAIITPSSNALAELSLK